MKNDLAFPRILIVGGAFVVLWEVYLTFDLFHTPYHPANYAAWFWLVLACFQLGILGYVVARVLALASSDLEIRYVLLGSGVYLIWSMLIAFTHSYKLTGLYGPEHEVTHNGFECFYFSVITWTSVGYGDFTPTPSARIFAAAEAFVGYLSMACLIAGLNYVFTNRDRGES